MERREAFQHFLDNGAKGNYAKGTVASWKNRHKASEVRPERIDEILAINGYQIIEHGQKAWAAPDGIVSYTLVFNVGTRWEAREMQGNSPTDAKVLLLKAVPSAKNILCWNALSATDLVSYLNNPHFEL